VVALRGVVAAVAAVAVGIVCGVAKRAQATELPSFLLFSGTNFWSYGGFLYGGAIWSPGGLDSNGFTLKVLLDSGRYNYESGTLAQVVDGTKLSATVMPGWHFSSNGVSVSVFAGPAVQDYRLTPNDPGARLNGFYAGAQFAADIWYQPREWFMTALSGAVATIGPTGNVRAAFGYRVIPSAFIGPEAQAIWCGDYQAFQFGAHVTSIRVGALEWSAGTGVGMTPGRPLTPYLHLGFDTRY
jgi:hypothetical protein